MFLLVAVTLDVLTNVLKNVTYAVVVDLLVPIVVSNVVNIDVSNTDWVDLHRHSERSEECRHH